MTAERLGYNTGIVLSSRDIMSENDQNDAMLTDLEARILGCLMEKQLTTPDTYPLTLNALVTGCNQKTSRHPVMQLTNGDVLGTVNTLRDRSLIDIDYGSRADKYQQKLTRTLHFDREDQALFSLLMLRGPQTLNELFSRSKRMVDFGSPDQVRDCIERHLAKLNPLLMSIPPQSGQREERYMHLLCGEPDLTQWVSSEPGVAAGQSRIDELENRIRTLEAQMAELLNQGGDQDTGQ